MIVAGFGFRSGATVESLSDAYARARLGQAAQLLATVADKLPLVQDLAQRLHCPAVAVAAEALTGQKTQTMSHASLQARGVGSVAEAAALAAAGPGARLLGRRVISQDGRATCALAIGENG